MLQTIPLVGGRFTTTLPRSVLEEGKTNDFTIQSIDASGASMTNAIAHAQVMCEVAAGRLTITKPAS